MENGKQLSAVSPHTRNRGHKMKLVGGRLNKTRKEEADPHPTRSRTVEVTATGCWGHQNFTCIGHTQKRKIGQGRVDKKQHSLAQEVFEQLGKIFWGKYHCFLNLLSYVSSRHCWQPATRLPHISSDPNREEVRGSSAQAPRQMSQADLQLRPRLDSRCAGYQAQLQNRVQF